MDDLSIVRQTGDNSGLHIVTISLNSPPPVLYHSPGSLGVLQSLEVSLHPDLAVERSVQRPRLQGVANPRPDGGVGRLQLCQDLVVFRFMDDQSRKEKDV